MRAEPSGRHLLLERPGFAVSIAPGKASVIFDVNSSIGHMSIPAPTPVLADFAVRDRAVCGARYTIPTGFEPQPGDRWIELVFLGGAPWSAGPFSASDAVLLAEAFRAWRASLPIDAEPVEVSERELRSDPTRFHLRRIRVKGIWQSRFECSAFAGVWLRSYEGSEPDGIYRVRVVGTWIYPRANATEGYGHMGGWPGCLEAETIEIVEVIEEEANRKHDGLTGLLIRRMLNDAFKRAGIAPEGKGAPIAVAMMDIDALRRINYDFGHLVGDEVLQRVAAVLSKHVGSEGIVTRWAGEEFALVLPETTLEAASAALERMLEAVRGLGWMVEGQAIVVTISAGVVGMEPGESLHQAIVRADDALNAAKRGGGNRVCTG